jgi:hypothetical protein
MSVNHDKRNTAPDALKALAEARKIAIERAKELEESFPEQETVDYSIDECFTQLIISMYASGLKLGMGVMPDGMAIYVRLSMPNGGVDPRAGMVSFVVHNDPTEVLRKAVLALEASEKSAYWKPDRFAAAKT